MLRIEIERRLLLKPEGAPDDWVCPRSDMADVYVDIKHPTMREAKLRWAFIYELHNQYPFNLISLEEYEIWLCYAGTNLSLLVPKLDEEGSWIWKEDKPAIEAKRIDFSREMTADEFIAKFQQLPSEIKRAWYERTMEVAFMWKDKDYG